MLALSNASPRQGAADARAVRDALFALLEPPSKTRSKQRKGASS